ncbi:FHA modulated ABC efflux pump with fused ATPase and integral membrane subunits [Nostoc sp. NIES-4103]|nr:FHA modulated ABC efflux pump with fused ATPase and integral membrane subunits [Nostoc sp. NIES-4103]
MLKRIAPFLIAQTLIPTQIAFAENSQPNYNQRLGISSKPAVARILTSCQGEYKYTLRGDKKPQTREWSSSETFLGSGYFVNSDGYLLTTANVAKFATEDGKACDQYFVNKLTQKIVDEEDLSSEDLKKFKESIKKESIENNGQVLLPSGSSLVRFDFNVKELGTPKGFSNDVAIIKIALTNAPVLELADSNSVNLQDEVLVIGYPTAADTENLTAGSILEASVTEGKVSNPNKRLQDNSPVLQIGVQVANGSSGSPVLNSQGKVIGIITLGDTENKDKEKEGAFVPIAIPSSTIKEFIIQSGLTNKKGVVDERYKQGLELFWKGDYEGAKAQFEAVKVLFPQHSEVARLIGESEQKIADKWANNNYTPWLVGIGAFLAGTMAVLLFVNLRKRSVSGSTESTESTGYIPEPTPEPVEEFVTEQQVQRATLQAVSNGFTHPYQPGTVMSLQTTYVELKNPHGDVRTLNLQGQRYQLGRDRNWSDIDLSQPGWDVISNRHAIFRKEEENYRIFDGDGTRRSTNGIWINGKLIDSQQGHLLQDGDQLKIGQNPENQVTLTYHNPASKQSFA